MSLGWINGSVQVATGPGCRCRGIQPSRWIRELQLHFEHMLEDYSKTRFVLGAAGRAMWRNQSAVPHTIPAVVIPALLHASRRGSATHLSCHKHHSRSKKQASALLDPRQVNKPICRIANGIGQLHTGPRGSKLSTSLYLYCAPVHQASALEALELEVRLFSTRGAKWCIQFHCQFAQHNDKPMVSDEIPSQTPPRKTG